MSKGLYTCDGCGAPVPLDTECVGCRARKPPTLRQRYAMAALTGLLAGANRNGDVDDCADDAFIYADAMLAAEKS